jgi:glucoamylase
VALSGEAQGESGVLALAFSESARGAYTLVRSALAEGVENLRAEFQRNWQYWGSQLKIPRPDERLGNAGLLSAVVLKMHEDRTYPGAVARKLAVIMHRIWVSGDQFDFGGPAVAAKAA